MDNNVILSIQDLNVKFTLRGQILHALRGVSLAPAGMERMGIELQISMLPWPSPGWG